MPILDRARSYRRANLSNDLLAAVIVTVMLIAQSLAYAMLAGLPPEIGLCASILPLVIYALCGRSGGRAVGLVAVVSFMTAASVSEIAPQGYEAYLAGVIGLALLSGLILLGMAAALLIAPYLDCLAKATLAATIIVAGLSLVDPRR